MSTLTANINIDGQFYAAGTELPANLRKRVGAWVLSGGPSGNAGVALATETEVAPEPVEEIVEPAPTAETEVAPEPEPEVVEEKPAPKRGRTRKAAAEA